jgi:NAD(P)H-dependent flavin oxidoreductase YrpB (nitropropane dioxygenase family)
MKLSFPATDTTVCAKESQDPVVISGGMGVWISNWLMARIVSLLGGMGIVSGTALDAVYTRILQQGDPEGNVRRAFAELVRRVPNLAGPVQKLLDKYFIEGGKPENEPYRLSPVGNLKCIERDGKLSFWEPTLEYQVLELASSFAEVWLAKEGHDEPVGINYLKKVERPLPWALYGAMLAGVDYVAIGAGSPAEIPGMIRSLSRHKKTTMPLHVYGATSNDGDFALCLRPDELCGAGLEPIRQPKFLAIVSSFALAKALYCDENTRPYGFIIETSVAGGHNAPPNRKTFSPEGEPTVVYTNADVIDVPSIAKLGLPFWMAGDYGSPEKLQQAISMGATGVQFGTLAALSGQSGLAPKWRNAALSLLAKGLLKVKTSARCSPSGFPFKVAQLGGTLSREEVYERRERLCDVGALQSAYLMPNGNIGFRCAAEPVEAYVNKGGKVQNTVGRVCLCNGLLASAGFPQTRSDGYSEPPIVTLGEMLEDARKLLESIPQGQASYTIGKALRYISEGLEQELKEAMPPQPVLIS